ncbi:protein SHQ1 homolog [Tetranychus urticae]|uniref:Protein SHQ1 homolog n=1 Tax=Tetranychus urticae TaxID=32264 RepID=T1K139_TETUR|nr:protein SHQ1 homolog [Tetranychus urticae]
MITPNFMLKQDDKYVYITIKAPMAKLMETQIDFEGNLFHFSSKPYYLRLHLPGNLSAQDGSEKIDWVAEENRFVISVLKENEGEYFEGLDMLTKLLTQPKKEKPMIAQIEILDQESNIEGDDENEEEIDWYIDQSEWTENDQQSILGEKYGFANRYTGIIERLEDEIWDLLDVKKPEKTNNQDRKKQRIEQDIKAFDEEHYWFDMFELSETIENLICFKAHWELASTDTIQFDDDEIFRLKSLPRREYLLSRKEKFHLLLGLVDILFAYAYDVRTTDGEHSCESGWTISKLSSTLSWFEQFSTLPEVLSTCVQRSLTYPLYRNWSLCIKLISDVKKILKNGRTCVIKCLLDIHKIFNESGDLRYILNDLYITDYCIWLQHVKEKTFISLADAFERIQITKDMINLDLELIEEAANQAFIEDRYEKLKVSNDIKDLEIDSSKH